MQTAVFIFTHLIMASAVSSVLYIGFVRESGESGAYPSISVVWVPRILNKFKAFGCSMKTRVVVLSGYVFRFRISNRLIRRPGQIL